MTRIRVVLGPLVVVALVAAVVVVVVLRGGGARGPDPLVARDLPTLAPTVEVDGAGVPRAGGAVLPSLDEQPGRRRVSLDGTWRSPRITADHTLSTTDRATSLPGIEVAAGGRQLPGYDDRGWSRHPVPSPETAMHGSSPPENYQDGVWYRRTVDAPAPAGGDRVRIVFQAVASIADVWVNGRWLGYHEGGYSPFTFDVTDLVRGGQLTVAVRVDNPPPGTGSVPSRTADWMNYTGIIGDTYLEYLPADGIDRVDAVPRAVDGVDPRERIALDVTVVLASPATVSLSLAHADVTPARLASTRAADLAGAPQPFTERSRSTTRDGTATVVQVSMEIDRPALWSPDDPELHVLTARSGADAFATQVGLRTVGVADGSPQILLNGRAAHFTGVNRHEEWPDSGRAVTDPARVLGDLLAVKGDGANLLRTAHYPNSALTYLVADRLGLAVIEEIPMWWPDAYTFADQDRRRIADQMWREMIFRDRNRASVIAWSAANEGFAPHARTAYLNRLVRDLRLGYPDGRLVTQSAAADRPGAGDPSQSQVDVAGWTLYPGTFDDASPADVTRRATAFLDAARAARPDQPMWVTEFGAYAGTDGALAGRQASLFDAMWAAVGQRADLSGVAWWAFADGFTPIAGTNTFGLATMAGEDRPVADRLRAAFAQAPPVTSGPWLPARPVLVPDALDAPDHAPVAPGVLSDFAAPDPAEPAGDADLEPRDGTLVLHPTGPRPAASVYLDGRPVDLRGATRLCLSVDDEGGGASVALTLVDRAGSERTLAAESRTRAGETTRLCAPIRDDVTSGVERITVTVSGSAGGDIVLDDLTRG